MATATDTDIHTANLIACPSTYRVPCAGTHLKGWGTPGPTTVTPTFGASGTAVP